MPPNKSAPWHCMHMKACDDNTSTFPGFFSFSVSLRLNRVRVHFMVFIQNDFKNSKPKSCFVVSVNTQQKSTNRFFSRFYLFNCEHLKREKNIFFELFRIVFIFLLSSVSIKKFIRCTRALRKLYVTHSHGTRARTWMNWLRMRRQHKTVCFGCQWSSDWERNFLISFTTMANR